MRYGGFDSLPSWLPFIPKSELSDGGRVRHLAIPNGETIVEQLEAFDNTTHSYSYSIVEAPFPVTDYWSTLRVEAADGGACSRVEWTGRFSPKGVSRPFLHETATRCEAIGAARRTCGRLPDGFASADAAVAASSPAPSA